MVMAETLEKESVVNATKIKKVGVAGCGLMGGGIVETAASFGYPVVVREVSEAFLDKGMARIEKSLNRAVEKGKRTNEQKDAALANITRTTNLDEFADCDLVVEAIFEQVKAKTDVFGKLDESLPKDVIFASNTSSISISELAAATSRPEMFIGMHFFNPVPLVKLVEGVVGLQTASPGVEAVVGVAGGLGGDKFPKGPGRGRPLRLVQVVQEGEAPQGNLGGQLRYSD